MARNVSLLPCRFANCILFVIKIVIFTERAKFYKTLYFETGNFCTGNYWMNQIYRNIYKYREECFIIRFIGSMHGWLSECSNINFSLSLYILCVFLVPLNKSQKVWERYIHFTSVAKAIKKDSNQAKNTH